MKLILPFLCIGFLGVTTSLRAQYDYNQRTNSALSFSDNENFVEVKNGFTLITYNPNTGVLKMEIDNRFSVPSGTSDIAIENAGFSGLTEDSLKLFMECVISSQELEGANTQVPIYMSIPMTLRYGDNSISLVGQYSLGASYRPGSGRLYINLDIPFEVMPGTSVYLPFSAWRATRGRWEVMDGIVNKTSY